MREILSITTIRSAHADDTLGSILWVTGQRTMNALIPGDLHVTVVSRRRVKHVSIYLSYKRLPVDMDGLRLSTVDHTAPATLNKEVCVLSKYIFWVYSTSLNSPIYI